jgi:hypothetical protein
MMNIDVGPRNLDDEWDERMEGKVNLNDEQEGWG